MRHRSDVLRIYAEPHTQSPTGSPVAVAAAAAAAAAAVSVLKSPRSPTTKTVWDMSHLGVRSKEQAELLRQLYLTTVNRDINETIVRIRTELSGQCESRQIAVGNICAALFLLHNIFNTRETQTVLIKHNTGVLEIPQFDWSW